MAAAALKSMCALGRLNYLKVIPLRTQITRNLSFVQCRSNSVKPRILMQFHPAFYSSQKSDFTQTLKAEGDSSETQPLHATTSEGKEEGKDKKKNPRWTGKNAWKLGLIGLCSSGIMMGGVLLTEWGAPKLDENGFEIRDEFTDMPKWLGYPQRAFKEMNLFKQMIRDPSSEKLLPDPLKEPYYQPPYTLVLEMTGVMVHPDWTLSTGWRFKKRPAVDYFLSQVGPPLFEVVVYTSEQGFTAFPILDSLDPNGYIMYRLFRDATRYQDGHHVKDLSCLNRDLSKVIIVDWNPNSYKLQPENAVNMSRWTGNDDDRGLVDLAAFLRTIASSGVEDVRSVLAYYNQFDNPLEAFRENQKKLQEQQEISMKMQQERQEQQSLASGWTMSLFGRKR